MQFLLSFILFCLTCSPAFSIDVSDSIALESRIRGWYTAYKRTAPPSTLQLKRSATFVGHLHEQLLQQDTEEGVDLFSRAILAVVGRGAGVGGLRTPRNDTDKSHLLTKQERAIVQSALLDAERLRRTALDIAKDYFGTPEEYFARAGSDQNRRNALGQHAKKIKNIAFQMYSLTAAINDPQAIKDGFIYKNLIKALVQLDLSRSVMIPEIYKVRMANRSLNDFDVFNMAFHDQSAMTEILTKWGQPRHDIPLAYFTLQGLPDSIPEDLIIPVVEEVSSLSKKRLAKKLLVKTWQTEEHILETLSKKSISGIRSTIILELFLNKYLPETGGVILPQDDLLHLYKIMGREIDNDPRRTEICLRALERFMNAYPTCPLANVINALISGITYSPHDQMTDFYIAAIEEVYNRAAKTVTGDVEDLRTQLRRTILSLNFNARDYPDLYNKLQALKQKITAN